MSAFDVAAVRQRFLGLDDDEVVLFDNAGGSQILRSVVDRVADWYGGSNVQLGASYARSRAASERLAQAYGALARFVGAASPSEVVLGPSSTQLVFNLAQSLVRRWGPGDEIIVSEADHAANISPWLALERQGLVVRFWPVDPATGLLDPAALAALLGPRTRLVCFTHCTNVTGAIEPAAEHVRRIHAAGALAMVDGVAYAPHRAVDVQAVGADFYVLSLYKTFGPHLALMRISQPVFRDLPGINHPFIGEDDLPYKMQPGHANYELSWGAAGIPEHLAWLGGGELRAGWQAIARHEATLVARLLEGLDGLPGVRIIGPATADPDQRVALVSFVVTGHTPADIVAHTDRVGIGIRHGHFYSPRLIEAMDLTAQKGVVRVSMAHYNTLDEVDRLVRALEGAVA